MRSFRLLLLAALLPFMSLAQLKDQDLDGITVKTKKLTVREILDNINRQAPNNYAEPASVAGPYTGTYARATDTLFAMQMPAYVFKEEKGLYGDLYYDSSVIAGPQVDRRSTKAHFDRTLTIEQNPFPSKSNTMKVIKGLYELKETERLLFAREGTEEDPYFYVLFPPRKKVSIPLIIRPFISSIDKDSLLVYSILKIRRNDWAVVSYENAMLLAPPATITEMLATRSFTRAKALIDGVKKQHNLRRFIQVREWEQHADGKYYYHSAMRSDNLLNISLAMFKKFPDPQGYIGTGEMVYDYSMAVPAKESLKPYSIINYTEARKKYSGK